MSKLTKTGLMLIALALLAGCASKAPPPRPNNLCHIFEDKRGWHRQALKMEKKWNVPVHIPMAMMYQESSFIHNARPPRKYILGFIPNGRISTAYGYSQALNGTWREYQSKTGNKNAERTDFGDAIDFMGWYIDLTHKENRVSKWNANAQYLNYHDGRGGYRRGTYKSKPWLMNVSKKVDSRAKRYHAQYQACKSNLPTGRWW